MSTGRSSRWSWKRRRQSKGKIRGEDLDIVADALGVGVCGAALDTCDWRSGLDATGRYRSLRLRHLVVYLFHFFILKFFVCLLFLQTF